MNGIRFEGRGLQPPLSPVRRTPLRRRPAYPPPRPLGDCAADAPLGDHGCRMSTRYLIIAALVTGLVILAASAIQLLMAR
jgi:hypothetical protein